MGRPRHLGFNGLNMPSIHDVIQEQTIPAYIVADDEDEDNDNDDDKNDDKNDDDDDDDDACKGYII